MSSNDESLTAADAEEQLRGIPLVPVISGSIAEMKALRDRCLASGIPVLVGCPPGAGKGWGTKTHLLVEEDEIGRIADILRGDWRDALAREGAAAEVNLSGDACPACGCTLPLHEGACADCGLQLE